MDISAIQKNVLPPQSYEASVTLQLAGLYSYFITEQKFAKQYLQKPYRKLNKWLGKTHYETLYTQLYLGYVLTSLGRNKTAFKMLSEVYTLRSEAYGVDDDLSITSLCDWGRSERIVGDWGKTYRTLREARALRSRKWDPTIFTVIDTTIHLINTYREGGRMEEAQHMLQELDIPQIQESQYPRYCQIKHLQALLLYNRRSVDAAVHNLELLMDEGTRKIVTDSFYGRDCRWQR